MSLGELTRGLQDDRRRHGGSWRNLALWAVAVHRFGNWASHVRPAPLRIVLAKVYGLLFLFVELTTGIVLNREAKIGEGFVLLRSGNVKIHPRSKIGDRVRIGHDVTLGSNMDRTGAPVVGSDVSIGSGSKILGPIVIGDGATIMPNSLVVSDVPAGATVMGVPGRVTKMQPRPEAVVVRRAALAAVGAAASAVAPSEPSTSSPPASTPRSAPSTSVAAPLSMLASAKG